jgi:hypothetical protein
VIDGIASEPRLALFPRLRRRLGYLENALTEANRERLVLHAEVRELRAYREETERLSVLLAEALDEHRAALAELKRVLG